MNRVFRLWALLFLVAGVSTANADTFTGNLFYTNYNGGANVNSVTYSYDDSTNAFLLGSPNNIAFANGADGIVFAPNGNLLVGGQGANTVHEYTPSGTLVQDHSTNGSNSYHLTVSPDGKTVYTSTFGGSLIEVSLNGGPTLTRPISGDDGGLTQVVFAPNGNSFYVDGQPNGFGNVGFIDIGSGVTARIYSSVIPAHGIIYDPFTGLVTLFGDGYTGTFDQNGNNLKVSSGQFTCDFDQGAVDGQGHALVAGCGGITLLDYSGSHDITHPDFYQTIYGFSYIDDVAPLVGRGSENDVPEPASLALFGTGLVAAAGAIRRRLM